jgi:lipopolysaccharide/colanic/teichoic acid biosynthesis glycosyltransferase
LKEKENLSRLIFSITRVFDILISLLAMMIFGPFLLIVMLVLCCSGEGVVFYRQIRVGRAGQEFYLLKFATMLKNSSAIGSGELTLPKDSRVLPVGRILRKTKLNELPQLWNILMGDLSLIGPRPQTRRYYNCYKAEDRIWIDKVRPGLSGVGSILFRDEETLLSHVEEPVIFDEQVIMPYKGEVEHWYVLNQSVFLYFELIFITMLVVLIPRVRMNRHLMKNLPAPPQALAKLLDK